MVFTAQSTFFGILLEVVNLYPFVGGYTFFFLIFNFGIIIDSHTVTRNNAEMSYLSFTQFPLDDNILQNHSTTSQPEY